MLIENPWFWAAAIPAILIVGISKGGVGGGLGTVGVPILSLVIDPRTAAAVLLPVLCLIDLDVAEGVLGPLAPAQHAHPDRRGNDRDSPPAR